MLLISQNSQEIIPEFQLHGLTLLWVIDLYAQAKGFSVVLTMF